MHRLLVTSIVLSFIGTVIGMGGSANAYRSYAEGWLTSKAIDTADIKDDRMAIALKGVLENCSQGDLVMSELQRRHASNVMLQKQRLDSTERTMAQATIAIILWVSATVLFATLAIVLEYVRRGLLTKMENPGIESPGA